MKNAKKITKIHTFSSVGYLNRKKKLKKKTFDGIDLLVF